jgi:hypothetical protein
MFSLPNLCFEYGYSEPLFHFYMAVQERLRQISLSTTASTGSNLKVFSIYAV